MTREQLLLDYLHHITAATTLNEALSRTKSAIAYISDEVRIEPLPPRYGVASSSSITVADSYEDALTIAKKRCQREPGFIVSVVAVQSNFVGKVNVEELV